MRFYCSNSKTYEKIYICSVFSKKNPKKVQFSKFCIILNVISSCQYFCTHYNFKSLTQSRQLLLHLNNMKQTSHWSVFLATKLCIKIRTTLWHILGQLFDFYQKVKLGSSKIQKFPLKPFLLIKLITYPSLAHLFCLFGN